MVEELETLHFDILADNNKWYYLEFKVLKDNVGLCKLTRHEDEQLLCECALGYIPEVGGCLSEFNPFEEKYIPIEIIKVIKFDPLEEQPSQEIPP